MIKLSEICDRLNSLRELFGDDAEIQIKSPSNYNYRIEGQINKGVAFYIDTTTNDLHMKIRETWIKLEAVTPVEEKKLLELVNTNRFQKLIENNEKP